jgi:hypothetical protein
MALHCINNSIAFGAGEKWGWQIPVVLVCALAVIAATMVAVQRTWGRSGVLHGRAVA